MRKPIRRLVAALAVLLITVAVAACSSHHTGGTLASDTGLLSVEIHDHPMPEIAQCWVTIDTVDAHRMHGEWMHVEGDYPQRFDLLKLQNGETRMLGAGQVPADDYDRIRLRITEAHLVMASGEEVDVPLPVGGHDIQVHIGRRCEVAGGSGAHVSLDFRVPSSFVHDAGEGWTCNPDIVVDDVWQHGQPGHHGRSGSGTPGNQ